MPRVRQERDQGDGWSRWVQPIMEGYRLICCDCGLSHTFEFRALEVVGENGHEFVSADLPIDKYRVEFRCRINRRSTSQIRRHMLAKRSPSTQ